MGIKPKGTEYIVVPPDNPTTRWGDWEASLDGAGDTAGEVFAETHAIARSAKSTAELAVERAQGYITAAENVTAELAGEIDPEHPDYLLWALANQVDQATQQALRAHSEAISANDIAVQALTRTAALMATVRYGEAYAGEHFVASWNGNVVTIAKRGTWVGDVTVMRAATEYTWEEEGHSHLYTNDARRSWLPTHTSGWYTVMEGTDVTILYQIKPGVPRSKSIDSPARRTLANGAWETLAQWVVPDDIQVSASGSFVWANKTYLGDYYARLTLDGVPVTTGEVSRGAPLLGHGPRTHQLSMRPRSASSSSVLRLEARAVHGTALNRQVRDVNLTMHWVEQGS